MESKVLELETPTVSEKQYVAALVQCVKCVNGSRIRRRQFLSFFVSFQLREDLLSKAATNSLHPKEHCKNPLVKLSNLIEKFARNRHDKPTHQQAFQEKRCRLRLTFAPNHIFQITWFQTHADQVLGRNCSKTYNMSPSICLRRSSFEVTINVIQEQPSLCLCFILLWAWTTQWSNTFPRDLSAITFFV